MTTKIEIATGPIAASRTFDNDEVAQAVLLSCARAIGVPESATNKERLQAVVDWVIRRIQEEAKSYRIGELRSSVLQQAESETQFK